MQRTGVLLVAIGIILALASGVAVLMLAPKPAAPTLEPTVKLVVAYQNIPENSQITGDQIGITDWPQHLPTPVGAYSDTEEAVGKFALKPFDQGQPLVERMISLEKVSEEPHSTASLQLSPGTLAVAIPVTDISNVAQAIQPGDRVDVLASFILKPVTGTLGVGESGDPTQLKVTQRLLENVLVLQIGVWPRPILPGATPTPSSGGVVDVKGTEVSNAPAVVVTLQVTSQDALVLKYMQVNSADFALALRPANDPAPAFPTPVTIDYMMQRFGFRLSDVPR